MRCFNCGSNFRTLGIHRDKDRVCYHCNTSNGSERFGLNPPERKEITGFFTKEGSDKVLEETFKTYVIGDAEETYKELIDYFNSTLKDGEKKRFFVKAQWHVLSEEEEHVRNCTVCKGREIQGGL